MEHDYKVAIIGAGASGCICAYYLLKSGFNVTLFDFASPLRTLLPTGGGRCNLAHLEFDIKDLAKNYPRGERFLYSVFSRFSTSDTLEMFDNLGIKTYSQENGRIFPESNSAKEVREIILSKLKKANFIKEKVVNIKKLEKGFSISTNKSDYYFENVVIAIGGHSGLDLVKNLGINVVEQKPSLVGLSTQEDLKILSGIVAKNCKCQNINGDILFTHFGISGPLVYTISSLKAFDKFPYSLEIDLCPQLIDLQKDLNNFPHKDIRNILNKYLPLKIVDFVLKDLDKTTKAHKINGKQRDFILKNIHDFKVKVISTNKGEETVTAGGIDLDIINSKSMEIKHIPNLYCIGEVLNIDGLCGGFNLQNAWSTAFVCADSIIKKINAQEE